MGDDLLSRALARRGGLNEKTKGVKALLDTAYPVKGDSEKPARKVYIALDGDGFILSIIFAFNREEADIFWQGASIFAMSVEELDPATLPGFPRVFVVATTEVKVLRDNSRGADREVRVPIVRRGA